MLREEFNQQIDRLKAQYGPESFKGEKPGLWWVALQHASGIHFTEAVDDTIANRIRPPALRDVEKAIAEAKENQAQARAQGATYQQVSLVDHLEDIAQGHTDERKAFALKCIELVRNRHKYSKENWDQAMDWLDQTALQLNPGACKHCDRTGLVLAEKGGSRKLYRCFCAAGKRVPPVLNLKQHSGDIFEHRLPEHQWYTERKAT